MKYRKKPVVIDAIQWTGDNYAEIFEFTEGNACPAKSHSSTLIVETLEGNMVAEKSCYIIRGVSSTCDDNGSLILSFKDLRGRTFKAVLPKFGWVVREGKTFLFYKDETFRKTFEEAKEDGNEEITDSIIKYANQILEDVRASIGNGQMFAKYSPEDSLASFINNFYRDGVKPREEVEKQLSNGLKDMAGSETNKATFESVLDEMKELHARKNACYGDAAHVNFLKYGPVASLSRLSEKMQRAEHILLSSKCEVEDEPLTETLIDIAITSAMLYMELKNKKNG